MHVNILCFLYENRLCKKMQYSLNLRHIICQLDQLDMYSHNILCTSTIRDTFHWHASNKHLYNQLHNDLIHILGHILFIYFYIRKKVKQSESISYCLLIMSCIKKYIYLFLVEVKLPISQNCPINPGGQTHVDLVGSM